MSYENIWPGYWRQLSLYSYLLSKNLLPMSSTGILVFINAPTNISQIEIKAILVLIFLKKF